MIVGRTTHTCGREGLARLSLLSLLLTLPAACTTADGADDVRDEVEEDIDRGGADEEVEASRDAGMGRAKTDGASGPPNADAASGAGSKRDAAGGNGGLMGDAATAAADAMIGRDLDATTLDGRAESAPDASGGVTEPDEEEVNVKVMGPYQIDTFTDGASAPEYTAGLVYYPTDAAPPFAVMVLSPGLTANNTDYEIWGRVLASHGIVVLLIQPTSTLDWNDQRAVDLEAGLSVIKKLNDSGPLASKLDTMHIGLMGQSMGGGGTLMAADKLGDKIQAAIPMEPYAPGVSFPHITAPTLVIAAELDTVASVSSNAFVHYNSIPDTTTKIYLEGAGKDHYFSTDRYENDFEINARYAVAFLKLYLEGDTRYETYLYGSEHESYQAGKLSRFLSSVQP